MKNATLHPSVPGILLITASLVVIIAGMYAAEAILVPLLLAAFISLLSAPLHLYLQRKGLPVSLSLSMVIGLILGILFSIIILIGSSLNEFTQNLPQYQLRLQIQLTELIHWLGQYGVVFSEQQIAKYFDPGVIFKLVGNLLSNLGSVMSNGFLIFLTVVFMLAEASSFPKKIKAALGEKYNAVFFETFTRNIQRYMALKTVISMLTGVIIGCWVSILGLDYPVLWGLVAFIFNFVPNIGSIMAAIPAVLLAVIDLGLEMAGLTLLGYLVVNIAIGDFIEPRVMGKGLGLSTLVVFLSLVLWAWVLGPVGMFLSVPLTMTIKIALDSYDETRWMAILLGPEPIDSIVDKSAQTSDETEK